MVQTGYVWSTAAPYGVSPGSAASASRGAVDAAAPRSVMPQRNALGGGYHKGTLDGLSGGGILHSGYVPAYGKLGSGLAPAELSDPVAVHPLASKASQLTVSPAVSAAISKQTSVRQHLKPRIPPPPPPKAQAHGTFTIQQLREERARRNGWSDEALRRMVPLSELIG